MSLLFNMLSRFVRAFLPRSKHLLISWLQSPSAVILESQKIKSVSVSIVSPSICHEVMGPDAMIFLFWMLNFKPAFHSSVSSSSRGSFVPLHFCHKRGVICILRLLLFLPAVLLPICDSSSLAFHTVYSAYKLNKQGDNIQPLCAPFLRLDHLNWSIFKSTDCFFCQCRFVLQPSKILILSLVKF